MRTRHIIFVILPLMAMAQGAKQAGIVLQYNGKSAKTPLPLVELRIANASPATSSANGNFTLNFGKLGLGDKITVLHISKPGYVIFNQQAVNDWTVRKVPLKLVMCDATTFDNMKNAAYLLGEKNYKRQYENKCAEVKRLLAEKKITKRNYDKALAEADSVQEASMTQLDKYAEMFARIDESELDDVTREALSLFHAGNTDEAIRMMEKIDIGKMLDKAGKRKMELEKAAEEAGNDVDTLVQAAKAQINMYLLKGGEESFRRVAQLMKRIADNSGESGEMFDYAYFCTSQKDYGESEAYYKKALSMGLSKADSAYTFNNLGLVYSDIGDTAKAEFYYLKSLELFNQISSTNTDAFLKDIATVLNNLGEMYFMQNKFSKSEEYYTKALQIDRELSADGNNSSKEDLAQLLANLAQLHDSMKEPQKAEEKYNEALKLFNELNISEPDSRIYKQDIALCFDNMAQFYETKGKYEEARTNYNQSIKIHSYLAEKNPIANNDNLAIALYHFAKLEQTLRNYDSADNAYKKSCILFRQLLSHSRAAFAEKLAKVLTDRGEMLNGLGKFSVCDSCFTEAIGIYRNLANKQPQLYAIKIADCLNNYTGLLSIRNVKEYGEQARRYAIETVASYRKIENKDIIATLNMARSLDILAHDNAMLGLFAASDSTYDESMAIYKSLVAKNAEKVEPVIANSFYNRALDYKFAGNFAQSENCFQQSIDLFRKLAKSDVNQNADLAKSIYSLGNLYLAAGDSAKAQKQYLEAINLCTPLVDTDLLKFGPKLKFALFNLSELSWNWKNEIVAATEYESILKRLVDVSFNDYSTDLFDFYMAMSQRYAQIGENGKVEESLINELNLLKRFDKRNPGSVNDNLASCNGVLAYYLILNGKFAEAEKYADDGLAINPAFQWILPNKAIALLLQGKFAEAKELCVKMKDVMDSKSGQTFKQSFLENLIAYERAGVIPQESKADVEKIKDLLNK
ncbi:MAG: tetratricopeptide repeat protein [Muribaculaceae bacterium]|jgi:tetratricopeptide (TPR) repeat protein|nr:tetratricopeptide repeat protein [Muribaculaceae bacterium]